MSTSYDTTAIALRYDPYGAATRTDGTTTNGATTDNPYEFQQGIQDRATGEIRFGQRYYSTTTGNWTQQDALNAPLDPANANRYEYTGDNPINVSDPTGQDFLNELGEFVGDLSGAATGAETGVELGSAFGPEGAAFGRLVGAAAGVFASESGFNLQNGG